MVSVALSRDSFLTGKIVPSLITPPPLSAMRWQSCESIGNDEIAIGSSFFGSSRMSFWLMTYMPFIRRDSRT